MALDPYAALGVDPAASTGQVTAAYRRMVRALHPDTGSGPAAGHERFTEVVAAYRLLRDPQRRADYDSRARRAARQPGHRAPAGPPPTAGPPLVVGTPPAAGPALQPALRVGPVRVAPLGGPARRA